MASERLHEVKAEFEYKPFQATPGKKNTDFCGKTRMGEEAPSGLKI